MKRQIEDLTYLGVIILAIAFLISSVLLGKNTATNIIFVVFTGMNVLNLLIKEDGKSKLVQALLIVIVGILYFM